MSGFTHTNTVVVDSDRHVVRRHVYGNFDGARIGVLHGVAQSFGQNCQQVLGCLLGNCGVYGTGQIQPGGEGKWLGDVANCPQDQVAEQLCFTGTDTQ